MFDAYYSQEIGGGGGDREPKTIIDDLCKKLSQCSVEGRERSKDETSAAVYDKTSHSLLMKKDLVHAVTEKMHDILFL